MWRNGSEAQDTLATLVGPVFTNAASVRGASFPQPAGLIYPMPGCPQSCPSLPRCAARRWKACAAFTRCGVAHWPAVPSLTSGLPQDRAALCVPLHACRRRRRHTRSHATAGRAVHLSRCCLPLSNVGQPPLPCCAALSYLREAHDGGFSGVAGRAAALLPAGGRGRHAGRFPGYISQPNRGSVT